MPAPPMNDSDLIWQTGTVCKNDGRVWLVFDDPGACSRCSSGTGCGAALFSRLFSRSGPISLPLRGPALVHHGQRVRAGLNPHWLMMAAAALYLLPVIAFLVGALAAEAMWPRDDLAALGVGSLFAGLAVWSTRGRLGSSLAPVLKLAELDPALESSGARDHFPKKET
ncbi:MAG: SoxR reducing system RseC family protein [Wenzhouxiangellaceae bacterium]|nr:SoxR reducing system RseC family protein [Wenzhouxiangellaceae bacterium]